jgi:hypothetical protein
LAFATGLVQAAALAEERAPAATARVSGVVGVALAAPQRGWSDTAPASCPYRFGSDMPAATFCVYRGAAFDGGGEVCATDVVVIWSSFDSRAAVSIERATKASGSNREVYLAFVTDSELVLRAIVDSRRGDGAEVVDYTLGDGNASQPLAGSMA